jgi:hypothetical protein
LRGAQQAYVAAGQDRVYWTTKVSRHLDTVDDSLENLHRLTTAPASVEALGAAADAIVDLRGMDERAREHANLEQPLLASDLIFTDGLELAARAAANVELARATERTTRNDTIRAARATQTTMLAVSASAAVLAMLLLAPMASQKRTSAFESLDEASSSEDRLTLAHLDLTPDEATSAAGDAPLASPSLRSSARSLAAKVAAGQSDGEPKPDLRAAADLCTDLSAVSDTRELPALLERAADLMNASGLIVWVLDSTGHALRPAIGHGYSPQALARIGSIPEDSSNATAAAFRGTQMQVVCGVDGASGALATPLRSANRCVGVLSAELRDGWESSSAVQASAAIVAAQLATLVLTEAPAERPADTVAPAAEAHG